MKKKKTGENRKGSILAHFKLSRRQLFNSIIFARNLFIFSALQKLVFYHDKCSTCVTNEYFMPNVKIVTIL